MCISTLLQCVHLCIYILHVQGVDCKVLIKNIFGHGIKLHTVLLYIDSIFTKQDYITFKNDWNIIFQCSTTYCDVLRVGTHLNGPVRPVTARSLTGEDLWVFYHFLQWDPWLGRISGYIMVWLDRFLPWDPMAWRISGFLMVRLDRFLEWDPGLGGFLIF